LECTAEGLLPIEELPGYFTYDEETLTLRSSKFSLHIADRVRVKVERVDIAARRAIFSLVL
jgi:exoribonuclease R